MRVDREGADFGGDRIINGDEEQGGAGNPTAGKVRGGLPGLPHGFSRWARAGAADAGVGIQSPDADCNDQRRSEAWSGVGRIRGGGGGFSVKAGGPGTGT